MEIANKNESLSIARVESAIENLRSGKLIILVDDEGRENEGDLVLAAQFATPDTINFMATHGKGLICLAMEAAILDRLQIPQMVSQNETPLGTAFTVSIEARSGITTGISAHDRAHTIQTAIRDSATRADICCPGHVFPLRAREGGVLVRAGQTEGSVDLARLAGLKPAGVICEILKDDGTMARRPDLEVFSKKFNIPIVSIEDIISYRLMFDKTLIQEVSESLLPTKHGKNFKIKVFHSAIDQKDHIALVMGEGQDFKDTPTLVRVHSECLTGDVFGSLRCDCGPQLDSALEMIAKEGRGVLLYLRQEGRGIGLANKVKAYHLQDGGLDTVDANTALGLPVDFRNYGVGAQILRYLGIGPMRLMSNNPKKIIGLDGYGLQVVERVPIIVGQGEENKSYIETKKNRMGHLFP
jgi:3,4-dihydroxy 2-butanone 4-phosphate synthase/GTP cyclohydrolase II